MEAYSVVVFKNLHRFKPFPLGLKTHEGLFSCQGWKDVLSLFFKLKPVNSRNSISVAFLIIHMAWGRFEDNKSNIAVPRKNILLHFKVLGWFNVQNYQDVTNNSFSTCFQF